MNNQALHNVSGERAALEATTLTAILRDDPDRYSLLRRLEPRDGAPMLVHSDVHGDSL